MAKIVDQKTTTFKIAKTEPLERAIARMPQHRSMRINGPAWRGRPLGHGIDPLRSALATMPPEPFVDVVSSLLAAHDFRFVGSAGSLKDKIGTGSPTVLQGRMHLTYEWVLPMSTVFGLDEGSDSRIEGAPLHVQGDVLLFIDPIGNATPRSLGGVDAIHLANDVAIERVI